MLHPEGASGTRSMQRARKPREQNLDFVSTWVARAAEIHTSPNLGMFGMREATNRLNCARRGTTKLLLLS